MTVPNPKVKTDWKTSLVTIITSVPWETRTRHCIIRWYHRESPSSLNHPKPTEQRQCSCNSHWPMQIKTGTWAKPPSLYNTRSKHRFLRIFQLNSRMWLIWAMNKAIYVMSHSHLSGNQGPIITGDIPWAMHSVGFSTKSVALWRSLKALGSGLFSSREFRS